MTGVESLATSLSPLLIYVGILSFAIGIFISGIKFMLWSYFELHNYWKSPEVRK